MNESDIIRIIKGLVKKHGKEFGVVLRYRTATGKIKKRYGEFIDLTANQELILFNPDKRSEGRYRLENITDIRKK